MSQQHYSFSYGGRFGVDPNAYQDQPPMTHAQWQTDVDESKTSTTCNVFNVIIGVNTVRCR